MEYAIAAALLIGFGYFIYRVGTKKSEGGSGSGAGTDGGSKNTHK